MGKCNDCNFNVSTPETQRESDITPFVLIIDRSKSNMERKEIHKDKYERWIRMNVEVIVMCLIVGLLSQNLPGRAAKNRERTEV
jgi:hypothetical protein